MGPVITINSATLVNKGLEVIEAHLLYDIPFDRIEVVVHPQSYVHSMVEFTDGSTLAQATPAGHAAARSRSASAGRSGCRTRRPPSTGPRRRPGSSSRWTTRRSRRSASPGRSARWAAPPPRCSMRRTRSAWRRSCAGRLPFTGIMDTVTAVVEEHGTPADGNFPDRRGRPRKRRPGRGPGPVNWRHATQRQRRLAHDDDLMTVLGIVIFVVGLLVLHRLARTGPPRRRPSCSASGCRSTWSVSARPSGRGKQGRDRVRHQGDPARRLHPHDRDVPAGRRTARSRPARPRRCAA